MSQNTQGDSSEEEEPEGEAWNDWGPEDEPAAAATSLVEPTSTFTSVLQAVAFDKERHGFDFLAFRRKHALDVYGTIKAVNWLRTAAAAGGAAAVLPLLQDLRGAAEGAAAEEAPWADERYLQPVLADDPFLHVDWDEEAGVAEEAGSAATGGARGEGGAATTASTRGQGVAASPAGAPAGGREKPRREAELEAEVAALKEELRRVSTEASGELAALRKDPATRSTVNGVSSNPGGTPSGEPSSTRQKHQPSAPNGTAAAGAGGPSGQGAGAIRPQGAAPGAAAARAAGRGPSQVDRDYFASYASTDIHYQMLRDKVRTRAYQDAIEGNPGRFRGATVLDVGSGTGILAMFAARAGARRVLAVEASGAIARTARALLRHNRLLKEDKNGEGNGLLKEGENGENGEGREGPVELLEGRLEDLPPVQVDVIISEWMGYALLFEGMLASVLHARDRWLKPGGAILPDLATIYVAAADKGATEADAWRDMYGFSYAPVWEERKAHAVRTPLLDVCPRGVLISAPCPLHTLRLLSMAPQDQDFTAPFTLKGAGECHAIVLWFDAAFSAAVCPERPVTLSTSPSQPPTHWAQVLLTLKAPVAFGSLGEGSPAVETAGAVGSRGEPNGEPQGVSSDEQPDSRPEPPTAPSGRDPGSHPPQTHKPSSGGTNSSKDIVIGELRGRLSMARSADKRGLEMSLEVEEGPGGQVQVMSYRMVMGE